MGVFPRFKQWTCFHFEFSLANDDVNLSSDWTPELLWFGVSTLSCKLLLNPMFRISEVLKESIKVSVLIDCLGVFIGLSCVVCKIRAVMFVMWWRRTRLMVENEKKNVLSEVLVISWEKTFTNEVHRSRIIKKYLVTGRHIYWGTKLVLLKMRRSLWNVKSIFYRTYLILTKNEKYVAGKVTRPLRDETHLAKEKTYPARCEKQDSPRNKRHAFRRKRKKETFEVNGRRDLLRETRHILWKTGHLKKCTAFCEKPGGWHWES